MAWVLNVVQRGPILACLRAKHLLQSLCHEAGATPPVRPNLQPHTVAHDEGSRSGGPIRILWRLSSVALDTTKSGSHHSSSTIGTVGCGLGWATAGVSELDEEELESDSTSTG